MQYRISFPNGRKRQWRQESKRYLDWNFWDVAERWSDNNESSALYGAYADGNFGLFLYNTGSQVTLPFKCWENENFTSRSETHNIRQLEHWCQVYMCLSGQEIKPVVLFVLFCHLWYVVWYPIRGDLPDILKKLPFITEICLRYSRISPHQIIMPEIFKNFLIICKNA